MKLRLALVALILLAFVGCDVNFNGYANAHRTEDWDQFDLVFEGLSPDTEGDDMLIMLNVVGDQVYEGETRGVFWATIEGAVIDGTLYLNMDVDDNRCPEPGHARLRGAIEPDALTGYVTLRSCSWEDFTFEGELVGGRLFNNP
jgi:hypothetical protein